MQYQQQMQSIRTIQLFPSPSINFIVLTKMQKFTILPINLPLREYNWATILVILLIN